MDKTVWQAHRGFIKVWKEIEPFVFPKIMDRGLSGIITVGYSHGAAIALICHEYIWFHRPELRSRIAGFGFGCPRVLRRFKDNELARRWEKFTVIRNIDDIVTHLPPSFLGYVHVGELLEIGKKGRYSMTDAHRPENIMRELEAYENSLRNRIMQAQKKLKLSKKAAKDLKNQ